jgi:hypothetical protein
MDTTKITDQLDRAKAGLKDLPGRLGLDRVSLDSVGLDKARLGESLGKGLGKLGPAKEALGRMKLPGTSASGRGPASGGPVPGSAAAQAAVSPEAEKPRTPAIALAQIPGLVVDRIIRLTRSWPGIAVLALVAAAIWSVIYFNYWR